MKLLFASNVFSVKWWSNHCYTGTWAVYQWNSIPNRCSQNMELRSLRNMFSVHLQTHYIVFLTPPLCLKNALFCSLLSVLPLCFSDTFILSTFTVFAVWNIPYLNLFFKRYAKEHFLISLTYFNTYLFIHFLVTYGVLFFVSFSTRLFKDIL